MNAGIAKGTGRFGLMQGAVACALYFGAASSNYITGVIASQTGFSAGFMFEGIVAVMGAAWFLLAMPETHRRQPVFAAAEAEA